MKGEKKSYLSRALTHHISSIQETFKMMETPAVSSLDKVEWSQVIKLGEEVSKQATVAGMLWSGESAGVEELESNMGVYFNVLQGFLLFCHGSTVGAGPTLHSNIHASAKQVLDCSISLLKEAVLTCESHCANKKLRIPQLSGLVGEACFTLTKIPTTNYTAVGRAITQIAVSVKDIVRELKALKPAEACDLEDQTSNDVDKTPGEGSSNGFDLGDDLSPDEMVVAQLVTGVASDSLVVLKELIRFVSDLGKNSENNTSDNNYVDLLESLMNCCREVGAQVNELGACVYPPQELPQVELVIRVTRDRVDEITKEVRRVEGSQETLQAALSALRDSLEKLESRVVCLDGGMVSKFSVLTM